MEPASIFLGGLNGNLTFGASWLDRVIDRLPGSGPHDPSSLRMTGEMALSLPNPNTQGDVYLDDFDSSDELSLSVLARDWHLGSAPEEGEGLGGELPLVLDGGNAIGLVWQHTWIQEGPGGDSLGVFEGFFPRRDLDQQINIAGTETREPGLRLTLSEGVGGGARPGGARVAFHHERPFQHRYGPDPERLPGVLCCGGGDHLPPLDLGRVSEDALFVDGQGRTSGTHPGTGEPWGLGFLDQEADPRMGEIWNGLLDEGGVWVEDCLGARGRIYPLGDPRANCTRANGRNDTEDLDGDGNLLTGDRVYRYVIRLDGSSPYLVRTQQETGSSFQLYRIPLRGPDAVNVGGQGDRGGLEGGEASPADRHRVGQTEGSPWLACAFWGPAGSNGVPRESWPVSRGTSKGPGARWRWWLSARCPRGPDTLPRPGSWRSWTTRPRPMRVAGWSSTRSRWPCECRNLGPGERAEVYSRFPQRPRNFLTYRQLRIWVLGRDGDWGSMGGEFFLKVGTDPENFYLFRTQRPEAPPGDGISPSDWIPEVIVEFEQWLSLRREAEEELIRNPPSPGGPPLAVWSADSTYAVFLKDRARAPNLAAVREVSWGFGTLARVPLDGTFWVNELRLAQPLQDSGLCRLRGCGARRTSNSSGRR